ncbi:MAG: pentapeptide repeat-containing protein [Stenomitos rutilans HA7619-LM2]|jgi:uncharacterized protein YjbI with pentapeptide repeats|nr:pentapeptide repeat-containing protein [Stenomitos rutilans HA7619-LM2]
MKLKLLLTTALLFACITGCSEDCKTDHQYNPDHLKRLLTTKECDGCDLWHADLTGIDLAKANLRNADLVGAKLYTTNLREADLSGAKFQVFRSGNSIYNSCSYLKVEAYLARANLSRVKLARADLSGIDMGSTILDHAVLREAKMSGVRLDYAQLNSTDLKLAQLMGQHSLRQIYKELISEVQI